MMYPTVRPQIIPTMVAIGMAAAGCPRETWYDGNALTRRARVSASVCKK